MIYDSSKDWSVTTQILLALCFVELLDDGSQLLSEYVGIHEVDNLHYEEFFSR